MASFSIHNIAIRGIASCVPRNIEHNLKYSNLSLEEINKFIETTGVAQRHIVQNDTCTSDLCYEASEKLINELGWEKEKIEILVFVSQTSDYILPVTSAILQNRLGLSKECLAFDIPLGCSGYVYGLSVVASMMKATGLKKGLLLAGDTISKIVSSNDKSTSPLFGDAGSATALEIDDSAPPMLFNLGTDGSGSNAIIIPDGGARNPTTQESLKSSKVAEGIERNNCNLVLEGMDVFSFGISQAPKTVNGLIKAFNLDINSIDYFVFHQANMMMNKMIVKKLKIEEAKVPYSLKDFGNTSSATIPLTIVTELKEKLENKNCKLLLCGFGVGLSWGSVYVETNNLVCLPLIEI